MLYSFFLFFSFDLFLKSDISVRLLFPSFLFRLTSSWKVILLARVFTPARTISTHTPVTERKKRDIGAHTTLLNSEITHLSFYPLTTDGSVAVVSAARDPHTCSLVCSNQARPWLPLFSIVPCAIQCRRTYKLQSMNNLKNNQNVRLQQCWSTRKRTCT